MGVTTGRQAEGRQSNFQLQKKEDAMKLKNLAVVGLVLVGAVGAVISFMVFAAIIRGSDSDDHLCGTVGNDVFRGFAGDDVMNNAAPEPPFPDCPTLGFAVGGNDRFWGGDDDDIIFGGVNRDYIDGSNGEDILSGGGDQDRIFGGDGPDTIDGGGDADRLEGGPGDDKFINGAGNDWIRGSEGNDAVEEDPGAGATQNDTIYGDAGDDYMEGGDGLDKIFGGTGDDYIDGGPGDDYLDGGPGLDTIFGNFAPNIAAETDTYVLRVGDVPDGAIENIYCTMEVLDTGLVVLMRGPTMGWPRDGTPTGTFPPNTTVVIVDPSGPGPGESGEYHIHTGPGTCRILRR
jgi:Ca2+-binding RTX toxin-like protein